MREESVTTYKEMFTPETRVIVRCSEPGTDRLWHNRRGVVTGYSDSGFVEIRFDKPIRGWPNPALIGASNVRLEKEHP